MARRGKSLLFICHPLGPCWPHPFDHLCGYHVSTHQQGCRPLIILPFIRPFTQRPPFHDARLLLAYQSSPLPCRSTYDSPVCPGTDHREQGHYFRPFMEVSLPDIISEQSHEQVPKKKPQDFPQQPPVFPVWLASDSPKSV